MSAPSQTLRVEAEDGTSSRFHPADSPVSVGRDLASGVRVVHDLVSRHHLRLVWSDGWHLEDLGSRNGTWADGVRVHRTSVAGALTVRLGDPDEGARLHVGVGDPVDALAPRRQMIGRDQSCDVVVDDPMASRRHAVLERVDGQWWLEDLGSTNHTIIGGELVGRRRLDPGDQVLVGNTALELANGTLVPVRNRGLVLDRATLALRDGRRIVQDVSFRLDRPSMVAVIGPSGAGKSSLLRLVTGQLPPTSGSVSLDGATMTSQRRAHRGQIGVVPQHTVAHAQLTARQALAYTARLRLPSDMTGREREERVGALLAELGLAEHGDTRVARLSGGQQRRLAIGMEMLTDPDFLILDEPTAGLDPSLVLQIMRVMRGLADRGKRIFLVTHDLEHLGLVDEVVVLRAGGTVAYQGPPADVFAHFGTATWAETFERLGPDAGTSEPAAPNPPATVVHLPKGGRDVGHVATSARVVLARQARLVLADPLYAALLVAMPLALALLALAVPGSDGFGLPEDPTSTEGARLLVLMVVGAAFLGLSGTVRDLVAERGIYEHEREAGLSPSGYLASKVTLFSSLVLGQTAVLVGVVLLVREPPSSALLLPWGSVELYVAVAATALAGVALGLAVSAYVSTAEQTMPPLVLLVMGQLVMCGGLFPIDGRGVLEWTSVLFPTRWGYAAAASSTDLTALSAAVEPDGLWRHEAGHWLRCLLVLGGQGVLAVAIAARGLTARRSRL